MKQDLCPVFIPHSELNLVEKFTFFFFWKYASTQNVPKTDEHAYNVSTLFKKQRRNKFIMLIYTRSISTHEERKPHEVHHLIVSERIKVN
jgi:hypothetical protein